MRGLFSTTIFCLLSFQSYAQSSDLKTIILQLDSMVDGPVQGHFKNNVLAFSGEVVSGKMSGQWLFWNGQGVLKSNSLYENGKKEGVEYLYDEEGRTLSESNFSFGLLEGLYIEYYELLRPALIGYYAMGKKDSIWTEYFPSGGVSYTQNFKSNF